MSQLHNLDEGPTTMVDTSGGKSSSDSKSVAPISVGISDDMSDQDIDAAIAEDDPEFLAQLKAVGDDQGLSLAEFNISDEDTALADEKMAWQNGGKFRKIILAIFPPTPVVIFKLKRLRYKMFASFQALRVRAKNYLFFLATTGKEKAIVGIKNSLTRFKEKKEKASDKFRYWSWKMKLGFVGLLALIGVSGAVIYLSLAGQLIPNRSDLFLHSLEDVADQAFDIPADSKSEPLYDNLRVSQNLFLLPKMIVNLKKSENSGPNPMGAFELFVEGMTQEVLVEVKDREVEVRDQMSRTLESFTFDQIDSTEGKKLLEERVRKELNAILTSGKIKKVLIKTAILKP